MRRTHAIHAGLAALLFVLVCAGEVATAQPVYGPILTVERDHFQVNGQPKFLFLASMFDAIREARVDPARLDSDLVYLKDTLHADGIRVMANWWEYSGDVFSPTLNDTPRTDTLFDPSNPGAPLRPDTLAALKVLLQKAGQKGLVVDLTFTRETLPSPYMDTTAYQGAIVATARELREYGNLLFDLQNEFNLGARIFSGPRLTVENVQNIMRAVNAPDADPRRIVTASTDWTFTAAGTGSMAVDRGLWVVDYHENRGGSAWYLDATLADIATQIRSALGSEPLPIYLSEPTPWGPKTNDDQTATHHSLAAAAAKKAGVAAWTFHQRAGFNLATQSFQARLATSTAAATEAAAVRSAIDAATWGLNPADETDFYHLDALGSVRAVSDQDGVLKARHDYFPFGDGSNTGVPGGVDARRFTGKERDAETGYDYFGARTYMARAGRFTTTDPELDAKGALADSQLWNRYVYVRNNPLAFTDPDGRNPLWVMGAAGAAVFSGWQVVVNMQQGRPWHENVGVEASKGFLIGATLGLAAPVVAGTDLVAVGGATAAGVETAATAGPRVQLTASVLGHIFREADGHVAASGAAMHGYIRLFETVAADRKNLRQDAVAAQIITQKAAQAGVKAYTYLLQNGNQVWVLVRNNKIFEAGINLQGNAK